MAGSDEDRGRSRRLGADDRGWSSTGRILGDQRIKKSSDTMCNLHRAQGDDERRFLGLASKPRSTVSPSLASKPVATVSPGLTSKPVVVVLVVWPQNHSLEFPDLGLKNSSYSLVIWASKSP
jgi:hypothetical protein